MVFLRRKVENLSQVRLMTKNIISESDLCAVNLIVDGDTCLPVSQILLLCIWLCPTHRATSGLVLLWLIIFLFHFCHKEYVGKSQYVVFRNNREFKKITTETAMAMSLRKV